jgi:hypothetical protein
MNARIESIFWALGALATAVAILMFGMNLMPSYAEASEVGNHVQWLFTWFFISVSVICSLAVAGYFLINGGNESRR